MGEQYGLRKDQLPKLVGDVAERTIRALIDRWVRAGLINRRTIFAGDHAWLWPTRDGLELSGDRSSSTNYLHNFGLLDNNLQPKPVYDKLQTYLSPGGMPSVNENKRCED
jgi:hypothetical protein